jgi:hypothetical protein
MSGVESLNDIAPAVISGRRVIEITQDCKRPDNLSEVISWESKQWSLA